MATFPETIVLLGVNHKTAPLELRERLAFPEGYGPPLALLAGLPCLKEFFLISTCNRVETLVSLASGASVEATRAEILKTLFPAVTERFLKRTGLSLNYVKLFPRNMIFFIFCLTAERSCAG